MSFRIDCRSKPIIPSSAAFFDARNARRELCFGVRDLIVPFLGLRRFATCFSIFAILPLWCLTWSFRTAVHACATRLDWRPSFALSSSVWVRDRASRWVVRHAWWVILRALACNRRIREDNAPVPRGLFERTIAVTSKKTLRVRKVLTFAKSKYFSLKNIFYQLANLVNPPSPFSHY